MRFPLLSAALATLLLAGCTARPPATPQEMAAQVGTRAAPGASAQAAGSPAGAGPAAGVPAAALATAAPAEVPGSLGEVWHWDGARQKLYPMVLSEADTPQRGQAPVFSIPLMDQAIISFVVDLPDRYIFTTTNELQRWGVPPTEFVQAALLNLRELSGDPLTVRDAGSGSEYWVFARGDGFDAARILLVDYWRGRAGNMDGQLVIAIPARDVLYAFFDDNPALVEHMRTMTDSDFSTRPHPITATWFVIRPESGLDLYQG